MAAFALGLVPGYAGHYTERPAGSNRRIVLRVADRDRRPKSAGARREADALRSARDVVANAALLVGARSPARQTCVNGWKTGSRGSAQRLHFFFDQLVREPAPHDPAAGRLPLD